MYETMLVYLLLLVVHIQLWGRCGRRNSPPASSAMDFIFCRPGSYHVSVDTVHPSLLFFFLSQAIPSPVFVFQHSLVTLHLKTTSVLLSCTSLLCSLPSVSPWCHRFLHGLLVCGHMPICTSSFLSLPVSSRGS